MESDAEIRAQLRALERAEAAPYTDFRPTPRWFLPAAALWGGSLAAFVRLSRSESRPAEIAAVVGIIGLAALIGVYVTWYQRYHGATPSLFRRKPPEIRRVMAFYVVGALVVRCAASITGDDHVIVHVPCRKQSRSDADIGGAAGAHIRKGDLLATVDTPDEVITLTGRFLQYYRENANWLERTYDFVPRVGLERIREVVLGEESGAALREAFGDLQ